MDNLTFNGSVYSPMVSDDLKNLFQIEVQSGSTTTSSIHASNSMHENIVNKSSSKSLAIDDAFSADANISTFLQRKVQIASYQWAVGSSITHGLDPWHLFLSNPAVLNKLQNYQLIKGDLKLSFYVNGTPFHVGMLLASYNYLDSGSSLVTFGGDSHIVTRSQRPHLYLNLATNKSGCLCLPFFLPTNYLSLSSPLFNAASIGKLNIDSFAPLEQLNSGTDTVTITVFAEMLNVKLTGPTMKAVALNGVSSESFNMFNLEPQSGKPDEYDNSGVISGPASAVAEVAGRLSDLPVIGHLALATQIGASAVGTIARMFGYSKPIQLADVAPMRNFPVSSLALTEGADTSQKLTMTGKAELTIDPSTVELDGTDELSMDYMCKKESYLTQFTWGVVDVVDDVLFALDVDPMAERRSSLSPGYRIIPTSLSFASRPFSAWSGTIKYRFQVIASQFHRGRIAIVYDPTGPLTGDPYNTTFNTIIDLEEGRDFTLEVKWQQDRPYCFITTTNTRTFYTEVSAAARVSSRSTCNGIIYARVVNELVVPDAVTNVKVLVSISAGDDFELVNPKGSNLNVSHFVPVAQSGNSEECFSLFEIETQSSSAEVTPVDENAPESETASLELTSKVTTMVSQKPLIFYGERFTSFRQLLKRYCNCRALAYSGGTTNVSNYVSYIMKQMPPEIGFDTAGVDATGAGTPYTYGNTNYINYLKHAYAGWRGSVRWKFVSLRDNTQLFVSRDTGDSQRSLETDYRTNTNFSITGGSAEMAYNFAQAKDIFGGGGALTQCRSQDALEVEVPYTTNLRFSKTKGAFLGAGTNTLANAYPGGDSFMLGAVTAPHDELMRLDTYVAAGEDFTFFGWTGAPIMYSDAVPVP